MFIPASPSGDERLVAFLPETLSATVHPTMESRRGSIDVHKPGVCAYWVEIVNGTPRVSYGVVSTLLDSNDFPQGIDTPGFTFESFLKVAGSPLSSLLQRVIRLNFIPAMIVGVSRPFTNDLTNYFPGSAPAFNEKALNDLLANPTAVPAGAVGWFKHVED